MLVFRIVDTLRSHKDEPPQAQPAKRARNQKFRRSERQKQTGALVSSPKQLQAVRRRRSQLATAARSRTQRQQGEAHAAKKPRKVKVCTQYHSFWRVRQPRACSVLYANKKRDSCQTKESSTSRVRSDGRKSPVVVAFEGSQSC